MISVGAVIGGPECSFFDGQLMKFMIYCEDNESEGSSSAEVNLVYHLPGSRIKPDYIGLRAAKFSKKNKSVMIQISVEEELIASEDPNYILQYIYETADEALGVAEEKFETNQIDYLINIDRDFLDLWKKKEGF